ncbi:MAG TPA: hypothetical protein VFG76_08765, partial [Candidatus Polarisedimenticolia bacterium]|nr:hypothetical protein [Candidatus Polarisedimenticolia bacterium]
MSEIVVPRREVLEERLRDVAGRTRRDGLDDLELRHLVEVASNHSLLLADTLREDRLGKLVRR